MSEDTIIVQNDSAEIIRVKLMPGTNVPALTLTPDDMRFLTSLPAEKREEFEKNIHAYIEQLKREYGQ